MQKFRPQFAPRPSKGALHKAAKEQTKMETLATVDKGEVTPADVEVIKNLTNDSAAGSESAGVSQATTEQTPTPAVESPPTEPIVDATSVTKLPTSEEQAKATEALITQGKVTTTVKPPKGTNDGQYTLGKKYSPKTDRNSETWGKICKALAEGPKTMKELTEVVKGHGDFLGYMTRGGHVIPYVPKALEAETPAS